MGAYNTPPDVLRELQRMRDRIGALEVQSQQAPQPICYTYLSSDFSLAHDATGATTVYIPWAGVSADTDQMWDAADPTKITLPYAGVWLVASNTVWRTNASGHRVSRNDVGPAVTTPVGATVLPASPTLETSYSTVGTRRLSAGDFLRLRCIQSSGGSLDVTGGTAMTVLYLGAG